jgi:hypothetical protein
LFDGTPERIAAEWLEEKFDLVWGCSKWPRLLFAPGQSVHDVIENAVPRVCG